MTLFITSILLCYLLGSFPSSIVISKLFWNIDIRDYGSGNAGGTNVVRVLGWKPGIVVTAMDVFKGFAATLWVSRLAFDAVDLDPQTLQLYSGCAAILGHIWTVFAQFQGGKGVGTAAGMIAVLFPVSLAICLVVFMVIFFFTRIVSVSSMSAAVTFPLVLTIWRYGFDQPVVDTLYYFSFFAAGLIFYTHRSNIKRLLKGTENQLKIPDNS